MVHCQTKYVILIWGRHTTYPFFRSRFHWRQRKSLRNFYKTYKAKQVRYGTSLRKVINQTRARYIRIFLEIVFMCLLYTRCYHICSMTNHCYSHYYFYVFNANKSNFACTKTILIYNWRRSNQVISFVV